MQKIVRKALRDNDDFEVEQVEFAASFSAEGKFLGFGVGGDMSMAIRIRPK